MWRSPWLVQWAVRKAALQEPMRQEQYPGQVYIHGHNGLEREQVHHGARMMVTDNLDKAGLSGAQPRLRITGCHTQGRVRRRHKKAKRCLPSDAQIRDDFGEGSRADYHKRLCSVARVSGATRTVRRGHTRAWPRIFVLVVYAATCLLAIITVQVMLS